nr:MAG TPA: hypothetical protein [Caudoviricetes sp.]
MLLPFFKPQNLNQNVDLDQQSLKYFGFTESKRYRIH